MKKLYISPNVQVVNIAPQYMIAESMNVDDTTTKDFGESLARQGGNLWEEEEIEEEME